MRTGPKRSWYSSLYVGKLMKKEEKRVRRQLDAGKPSTRCFVITLAANGSDYLDILSTDYLAQKALLERLPMIVGLAGTKQEALELVMQILQDCLRDSHEADIRAYLTGNA